MKKLIALFFLIMSVGSINVKAEENDLSMNFGTDITTANMWRGYKLADLSVQPEISIDYAGNSVDFSFGVWGTAGLLNDYSEIDVFASATWNNLTFTLTDYACTPYTYFEKFNENHALDICADYYFGDNFPLTLTWSSVDFAGDWSHYCQLNYDFSIGAVDMFAQVGCLPVTSTYYTDTEDFVLSNLSLGVNWSLGEIPFGAQFTYNPDMEDSYLSFSVSF